MAVGVSLMFEASPEDYEAVNEKMDVVNDPPAGMIIHTAAEADGKMRIFDVWESKDAFMAFAQERLGPAVAAVQGDDAPRPDPEIYELSNVLKG